MSDDSTINPPPPIDRDKRTDPPAADGAKPTPDLTPAGIVLRLLALEEQGAEMTTLVTDLHRFIMGPGDDRRVSVIDALQEVSDDIATIKMNSEIIVNKHREYTNEVARVHQENVRIAAKLRELEARFERFESTFPPPEPNGSSHSE